MAPGVTTCHLYLSVGELRGLIRAWMLLRRRATPRNSRMPIAKISRMETLMGMTAAPKGAMTMSRDLMPEVAPKESQVELVVRKLPLGACNVMIDGGFRRALLMPNRATF